MKYSFTIPGRMRGLNEYIDSCRRNAKGGGRMKRKEQDWVVFCIRNKLRGVHIKHPVIIHYHWYEPNRRRDLDNIAGFGHKVIQDALVECLPMMDGKRYADSRTPSPSPRKSLTLQ